LATVQGEHGHHKRELRPLARTPEAAAGAGGSVPQLVLAALSVNLSPLAQTLVLGRAAFGTALRYALPQISKHLSLLPG
jgi:hypothetical protein